MKHKRFGYTALRRVSLPPLAGGIDRSRPPHLIRDDRLSDACNVWWRDGMLRTRPALQMTATDEGTDTAPAVTPLPDGAVLYAKCGDEHRLAMVSADGTMHGMTLTDPDLRGVLAVPSVAGSALLYWQDSRHAHGLYEMANDGTLTPQEPYVPCVLSAGRATVNKQRADSGARIEPLNLLTPSYTCRYTTDGEGVYYWLPDSANVGHDAPFTVTYTVGGTTHSHTVNPAADIRRETDSVTDGVFAVYEPSVRCFYFVDADKHPVALPMADAADNLTLRTACVQSERFDRIYRMRCAVRYGERVFVSGASHRVHWSAAGNALYFPENNTCFVGDEADDVTGFGVQDDLLIVFKRHGVFALSERDGQTVTADALLSGSITDTEAVRTLFPVRQIHAEIGCPHPETVRLCGDRLVWLAGDGRVYALYTGGTYDARRVRPLSAPLGPMVQGRYSAARYGDRYLLASDNRVAVLDYSDGLSADPERAVWFAWEFPCALTLTDVGGAVIAVVNDNGWHTAVLNETSAQDCGEIPVRAWFTTKQYELGAERYKQVVAVTVWMTGDAEICLTDGDKTVASARITGRTGTPIRIPTLASRLKRCGFRVICDGAVAVDRVQLVHRRMGEIRE